MKFSEEPEKFMDSELELHQEIQNLFIIAAYPELYPILIQTNALKSILEMINHENTDISLSTINLLQEMTDIEIFQPKNDAAEEEDEDGDGEKEKEVNTQMLSIANNFIAQLYSLQGMELVIQNLTRLQDEKMDEDAQGVYHTMSIIENVLTINPTLSYEIISKTTLFSYLLNQLKKKDKKFDMNKIYFTEILSILLQSNPKNQFYLSTKVSEGVSSNAEKTGGLELLLQCISNYRKAATELNEEEELIENLFLCLNNCLSLKYNQQLFGQYEGLELMTKIFYEQQYAATCVLKIFQSALLKNFPMIIKFIDLSGLKIVFSVLMKKGMKSSLMKKMMRRDENCVSLLSNIAIQLFIHSHHHGNNTHSSGSLSTKLSKEQLQEYNSRFLMKFIENDYEKLNYCLHLFEKYFAKYVKTLDKLNLVEKNLKLNQEESLLEEFYENLSVEVSAFFPYFHFFLLVLIFFSFKI
jgi:beta-catenin-like protein 1